MSRFRLRAAAAATALASVAAIPAFTTPSAARAATAPGAVVSAPVAAPGGVAGTDTTVSFPFGGTTRSYTVFVPTTVPAGPRPVILDLHWWTGSAAAAEKTQSVDGGAVVDGAYVVYPSGIGGSWNGGTCCAPADTSGVDDVAFLNAVLNDVEGRFAIDARRIAMGGFSNGGIMAYAFACSGSTRVQSFFADGSVPLTPTCTPGPGLAFNHLHGLADTRVPWNGTTSTTLTTDGTLPPVLPALTTFASRLGCSGWQTTIGSLISRYVAKLCPAGSGFTLTTSAPLQHAWPTGSGSVNVYGVNETNAVWSFARGRWAAAGIPLLAVDTPSPSPSATPTPSDSPSATPTPTDSPSTTPSPSESPTTSPSPSTTPAPTGSPSATPTASSPTSVASPPVAAPGGVAGTDVTVSLSAPDGTRSYTAFVPNALPAGPRPLVVALHGLAATASGVETGFALDPGAVNNGTIVVYPSGIGNSWNAGTCCGTSRDSNVDDVAFIDGVLDDVEARYSIDAGRTAILGFSNGAMMAYRYACQRSSRVTSYIAASGVPVAPSCALGSHVGILDMHGLADTTVPWAGTTTSPLTADGVLPAVKPALTTLGTSMGCNGWTTKVVSALLTRYTAAACPIGATVVIDTLATTGYRWVTGPIAPSLGMDETGATWSFLLGRWNVATA